MRSNPFKAAVAMFQAISAALAMPDVAERARALAAIKPYLSRGKGRGSPPRNYGNPPGKYSPHQGEREKARRRRQMGLD